MPRGVPGRPERKQIPLRLSPAVADAVRRWADDELRSVNAQIEKILHDALLSAGRLPRGPGGEAAGPGSGAGVHDVDPDRHDGRRD